MRRHQIYQLTNTVFQIMMVLQVVVTDEVAEVAAADPANDVLYDVVFESVTASMLFNRCVRGVWGYGQLCAQRSFPIHHFFDYT